MIFLNFKKLFRNFTNQDIIALKLITSIVNPLTPQKLNQFVNELHFFYDTEKGKKKINKFIPNT